MPNGPQRPNWRLPTAQPAGPAAPGAPNRGRRRYLAAASLLAVAGTIAGIVYWLMRPAPPPRFLALAVTQSEKANAPVTAWADQDAYTLFHLTTERRVFEPVTKDPFTAFTDTAENIRDELKKLAERGASDGTR